MKVKLYVVQLVYNGDIYRIGNFCGKGAAKNWLKSIGKRFPGVAGIEIVPGSHSLCSPMDFESLYNGQGEAI